MSTLRLSSALLLFLLLGPLALQPRAQATPPEEEAVAVAPEASGVRGLAAVRVQPGEIKLDGSLDDAVWQRIAPATGFVQRQPTPGAAGSQPTEARIAYDDKAVYVAMRMDDTGVTSALGRRDERLASDYASVAFDSYGDDRTAFQFEVNPAGVQRDFLFYDDVREDGSWDAVWDVATAQDARGWTAEFRIPFSQLRYAATGEQAWGVQFFREIHRTGERLSWAPMPPTADGFVSLFGDLRGLSDLTSARRLELLPYTASSLTRAPGDPANPFYRETDLAPRVGLDVKYGITSDITLTATVNPDFGQVEADPAQVNLGGFELFFGERRPFFVEGTDVFSMEPRRFFSNGRPSLLYTRRIGRSPQRDSFVPSATYSAAGDDGVVYTDAPEQTTILGAAKVTGRVGRFSFGILDAVTAPEHGRFHSLDARGQSLEEGQALIEPASNYLVARTQGTFGPTRVGGLLTAVNRDTGDAALMSLLPRQAYVGGLDAEHTLAEGWVLNGQVAGSVVEGSADAITSLQRAFPRLYQRPDARGLGVDTTRTSLSGFTGEMNLLRTSGTRWVGSLHANITSPGFDSNALGFQSRADQASVGGVLVYLQNEEQGAFQNYNVNVFGGSEWNWDGDRTGTFVGGNFNGTLTNFWSGGLNWNAGPRSTSDRLTRGGPLAQSAAGGRINAYMNTDSRKRVSGSLWSGANRDELGSWFWGIEPGVEVRPAANLSFSLSPELNLSHSARQYVTSMDAEAMTATFGRRYVFGEVDQTSVALSARLDWTFTPDLSLQLYARPFIASGTYSRFKQLGEPGQLRFPVFGEDVGTATTSASGETTIDPGDGSDPFTLQPNFTVRSIQGNAVLRWQYRPGSSLFLVWQQQRSGYDAAGDIRFGRDARGLFQDDLTNVFLVKLSYWLG
ncbi:DUF5916 domain-containing protein [Rubricoccus marinus]|uniref:Uncharacterized protein n=1 Tax=Rubricoccus marinus TaxID=716817 RepID=A0A259TWM6_9BACT|nr:DUF5916 domain-containing protein [Rubricoccus marinus]OZC02121.1 hypothetical protein BSZ36_03450 [Rubricoccus marinus]